MIFGIEASTSHASLALLDPDSDEIVWQSRFVSERAHNAVIFEPVEEMLAEYRDRLSGIVVGLGPGSYGGIRVGISVANGISLVLGIPARGVSSLESWNVAAGSWYVLGDARRKTTFLAEISGGRMKGEPELLDDREAERRIEILHQSDATLVTPDSTVAGRWEAVSLSYPDAEGMFRNHDFPAPESWPTEVTLEPHYLRAPYITIPKKNAAK
jgi:tRNA threonylcarbamoyladenosine biosynthesis protein TsaB